MSSPEKRFLSIHDDSVEYFLNSSESIRCWNKQSFDPILLSLIKRVVTCDLRMNFKTV